MFMTAMIPIWLPSDQVTKSGMRLVVGLPYGEGGGLRKSRADGWSSTPILPLGVEDLWLFGSPDEWMRLKHRVV